MVTKVKSQVEAHLFGPIDLISIIGFLVIFKLACDTNRILERAAMWVLLFFARNALALTLSIRMLAATNIAVAVASIQPTETEEAPLVVLKDCQLPMEKVS